MAASSPLVSVILPTHNRAEVLPFAIRSILQQTIVDLELLVVGDGCTDNSGEVVRSFRDPRITWMDFPKAPNFGYANRNIAFRQAKGEFISFLAHDDIVFPDHLEQLLAEIDNPDIDLVYSRPLWISRSGIVTPSFFNLDRPELLELFLALLAQEIPASCVLHRRTCFSRYGYWNEELSSCGDWEYWVRIIKGSQNKNFRFLAIPTSLHFLASWRTPDQISPAIQRDRLRAEDKKDTFPSLQLPLTPELTEQECVWNLMKSDPDKWVKWLRSEVQRICDGQVAWAERKIAELSEQDQKSQHIQQDLTIKIQALQENLVSERVKIASRLELYEKNTMQSTELLDKARQKLDSIENSKGWRCLNKIRELRAFILKAISHALVRK